MCGFHRAKPLEGKSVGLARRDRLCRVIVRRRKGERKFGGSGNDVLA